MKFNILCVNCEITMAVNAINQIIFDGMCVLILIAFSRSFNRNFYGQKSAHSIVLRIKKKKVILFYYKIYGLYCQID